MDKDSLSRQRSLLISNNSNSKIIFQIDSIQEDDLNFIEKDLSFKEKVSLGFLLFANTKANAFFILQKLLTLYGNKNLISDLLFCYSKLNRENWRYCLVEALAIIRAHRVLRKLGIKRDDCEIIFLPNRAEVSLYIHPILKVLYLICEGLNIEETKQLILSTTNHKTPEFLFHDASFLEIFLLDWITKSLIKLAEWPSSTLVDNKCDLKIISNFLKQKEKDLLKSSLDSVCNYIVNSSCEVDVDIESFKKLEISETVSTESNNDNAKQPRKTFEAFQKEDCYKLDRETAGYVLIINQKKFYEEKDKKLKDRLPKHPLRDRNGTDKDKDSLKETFERYGFTPYCKDNLTNTEIIALIRNYVKKSEAFDSLIICILSHGDRGIVYGANSIPVEISEIKNILASSFELYNKPKVLIIQACRGTKVQSISGVESDVSSLPSTFSTPVKNIDPKNNTSPKQMGIDKADFGDILVTFPTVDEYVSFRDPATGSLFIQTFCNKLKEKSNSKHLSDILVEVTREVSKFANNKNVSMVPNLDSTLRKDLWFPKVSV